MVAGGCFALPTLYLVTTRCDDNGIGQSGDNISRVHVCVSLYECIPSACNDTRQARGSRNRVCLSVHVRLPVWLWTEPSRTAAGHNRRRQQEQNLSDCLSMTAHAQTTRQILFLLPLACPMSLHVDGMHSYRVTHTWTLLILSLLCICFHGCGQAGHQHQQQEGTFWGPCCFWEAGSSRSARSSWYSSNM